MTRKIMATITAVAVAIDIAMILGYAPVEARQGAVQKLFYVHVPSAWVAYLAVAVTAIAGAFALWRRDDVLRWDAIAASAAEVCFLFTTVVLITGPIWGRRIWGVWWVWDARLTSTLVLWALFAGYLAFRALTPPGERRARACAVIAVVAAVDVPVIHFSVVWWRTLHPLPTVMRAGGPSLPGRMLATLFVSLAVFTWLAGVLLAARVKLERSRELVRTLETVS